MHRSSETIGAIATALAKAQAELTNPEKSLVGTIRSPFQSQDDRTFRYAPLSTGLDIVRKTLGKHEIAAVQTTSIDKEGGLVHLSTVLAHASGEWISSDWPVCSVKEIVSPHRMGAALTYAGRYALFTLVGITGEDDLDAPDLVAPTPPILGNGARGQPWSGNGSGGPAARASSPGRNSSELERQPRPVLTPEDSAAVRDRLLKALTPIASAEEAAIWAQKCLPVKNTLTEADCQSVEQAFEARVQALGGLAVSHANNSTKVGEPARLEGANKATGPVKTAKRVRSDGAIDKSVLALPEPRRMRDKSHIKFVSKQPCLICGRQPADAHHLRFAQNRALGRKVSDELTVPLCRGHHREVHNCADEGKWWQAVGVDALAVAEKLWAQTHPIVQTTSVSGVMSGVATASDTAPSG
jgi:ERF superfamily